MGGQWKKASSGFISETVRCQMLVGTLLTGCRYATCQCDLDLTIDITIVTLTFKILSKQALSQKPKGVGS